jgi:transposase
VGRERRYPSDLNDAQWEIVKPMLPLLESPGRIAKHPSMRSCAAAGELVPLAVAETGLPGARLCVVLVRALSGGPSTGAGAA